jgi:hypothetical protein
MQHMQVGIRHVHFQSLAPLAALAGVLTACCTCSYKVSHFAHHVPTYPHISIPLLQAGSVGEFLQEIDHVLQLMLLPGTDGPMQAWHTFGAAAAAAIRYAPRLKVGLQHAGASAAF